jgi:8-oxo-dGTP diphosphatase
MLKKYLVILAVGAFITDSKKRILIVKKSPQEKIDGGLWTIPGGKVYPKEGINNALIREVKEEVNLNIVSYKWIGEDVFISNNKYFHSQHYLCQVKNPKLLKLETKLTDYYWLSSKDINRFNFPKKIKKRILLIFKKNNRGKNELTPVI